MYLWLVHVDVWQKPTQYCKAIILQLKINKFKKERYTEEKTTTKKQLYQNRLHSIEFHWDQSSNVNSTNRVNLNELLSLSDRLMKWV